MKDFGFYFLRFTESNFYDQSWLRSEEGETVSPPRQIHSPLLSTPSPLKSSLVISSAAVGICINGTTSSVTSTSPSYVVSYVNGMPTSPGVTSSCTSPILLHQTPIKSRDIGDDMEAIRLSRQDNPYLQVQSLYFSAN